MIDILMTIYLALAMIFLLPTLDEAGQKSGRWDRYRVLGVLACLAWPVTLLCVLMAIHKQRPH